MIELIRRLGQATLNKCADLGRSGCFLLAVLLRCPRPLKTFPLFIEQLYSVGVASLAIIIVSALFVGMVIALQGYNILTKFGAAQQLGQMVALSVVRELGPVMTALLFAGRAGSALTAEIGLMKTTEQLAAMEMMGVDPLWRVISPRLWAGFISVPVLTTLFNMVAIIGGYLMGVRWLGVDDGSFWSNMQASVSFDNDILTGLLKSVVFGFVVTWVAVFEGYDCEPTPAGMAKATTHSVVLASLMVLGLDFVLTAMMIRGW